MKDKARTYAYLENTMTVQELDQFAKDVATSYATSEYRFSWRYYTKFYNITKKCFYSLLRRAVVRDLVPDEIVNKMKKKSSANSNRKSRENTGKGTIQSEVNYAKMIGERRWFIFLRDFPKETKIEITTYFAEHPEASKEECADKYGIPRAKTIAIDKIIEDTLLQNYVDDKIYEKIRERSLGANPSEVASNYFKALKRKRNKNKKTAS